MGLFSFLFPESSKVLDGMKEYSTTLLQLMPTGATAEDYDSALNGIILKYNLNETEKMHAIKKALGAFVKDAQQKGFADDNSFSGLINFMNYASLDLANYYASTIYDLHRLWTVNTKGELPILDFSDLDIIPKKNEVLHFNENCDLCKNVRHTTGGTYSGVTASFKIYKGIRYRVGTGAIKADSETSLDSIDDGLCWITNLRVGFIGTEKAFSIPFDKIMSFRGDGEHLFIYKENVDSPKIVKPQQYDLACSILSTIVNQ